MLSSTADKIETDGSATSVSILSMIPCIGVLIFGLLYVSAIQRDNQLVASICSPVKYIVEYDPSCEWNCEPYEPCYHQCFNAIVTWNYTISEQFKLLNMTMFEVVNGEGNYSSTLSTLQSQYSGNVDCYYDANNPLNVIFSKNHSFTWGILCLICLGISVSCIVSATSIYYQHKLTYCYHRIRCCRKTSVIVSPPIFRVSPSESSPTNNRASDSQLNLRTFGHGRSKDR